MSELLRDFLDWGAEPQRVKLFFALLAIGCFSLPVLIGQIAISMLRRHGTNGDKMDQSRG